MESERCRNHHQVLLLLKMRFAVPTRKGLETHSIREKKSESLSHTQGTLKGWSLMVRCFGKIVHYLKDAIQDEMPYIRFSAQVG